MRIFNSSGEMMEGIPFNMTSPWYVVDQPLFGGIFDLARAG
jgi:hypothetical protein